MLAKEGHISWGCLIYVRSQFRQEYIIVKDIPNSREGVLVAVLEASIYYAIYGRNTQSFLVTDVVYKGTKCFA